MEATKILWGKLVLGAVVAVICVALAVIAVPAIVHLLRHQPERLEQGTQHLVLAGQLIQILLLVAAALAWRSR